jgi:hypothetical protein
MSNPTTPFSWQMPTNTDLVTDLPADFEVFGQAVATSMADLLGGTSGQILAKNSNTDMDFVWIANDQGDITGITATSPLTGGGTSGAVTVGIQASSTTQSGAVQLSDSTSTTSSVLAATPTAVKSAYDLAAAAVPKSTVTTAGDVIYATGSSAVTRLGIGSAGQVLTVASGVPAWATPAGGGGMTSLATGSLSGATTTISSISGSYKNLQLVLTDFYPSTNTALQFTFNSISNYANVRIGNAATDGAIDSYSANAASVIYTGLNDVAASDNNNTCILDLFDYANSSNNKVGQSIASFYTANTFYQTNLATFTARSTGAITSINIKVASGTFSGGTYTLYGVN